jgi:hypothetical protein
MRSSFEGVVDSVLFGIIENDLVASDTVGHQVLSFWGF